MNKVYVGLDLGSSSFQQAALDHEGAITMNRSYPTSEANLRTAFADLHGEIHVHLEAGELASWAASDALCRRGPGENGERMRKAEHLRLGNCAELRPELLRVFFNPFDE